MRRLQKIAVVHITRPTIILKFVRSGDPRDRIVLQIRPQLQRLIQAYTHARHDVISCGYLAEIEWQESRDLGSFDEPTFLRESAWVVLSAGMRESVIRSKFPAFSEAFLGWISAHAIATKASKCRRKALAVFGHTRKVDAIVEIARHTTRESFAQVKQQILNESTAYLQSLPYVGPVTAFHLAKNLGLDCAKADRHLIRIADAAGYSCVATMCREIAATVGERVAVVDLVLWRYAVRHTNYLALFSGTVPLNDLSHRAA